MLVDSLIDAEVVLPSGRSVHASEQEQPGPVLGAARRRRRQLRRRDQFTYRTYPTPDARQLRLRLRLVRRARRRSTTWQRSSRYAPQALAVATFRATKSPPPLGADLLGVTCGGLWYGKQSDLDDLVAPLIALGPTAQNIETVPFLRPGRRTAAQLSATRSAARSPLWPNYQRSDFVNKPMSMARESRRSSSRIARWPGGPTSHEGGIQIEALGPPSGRQPDPQGTHRLGAPRLALPHRLPQLLGAERPARRGPREHPVGARHLRGDAPLRLRASPTRTTSTAA